MNRFITVLFYLGGDLKKRCALKNQSIEKTNHIFLNTVGKIQKNLDLPRELNDLENLKFDLKTGDCLFLILFYLIEQLGLV